jgi:hypothetical protein
LRQRYPREVRQKSFFRAIRSLRRMGRILDYTADYGPGRGGRCRYIALAPIYEVGGRHYFAYKADCELAALSDEALRQPRTVAAARGFLPEPSRINSSEGISVDTYHQGIVISD